MAIKKHIPNLITSLNLAAGFAAIIYAAGDDLITSSWLILAAMLFDFADGLAARLMKAYSEIGKELDSLADIVSFGVAPGILIFKLVTINQMDIEPNSFISINSLSHFLTSVIVVLMPVCAALRLAKFNIDSSQKTSFKGLPTPANALAVISIVFAENYSGIYAVKAFSESPVMLLIYSLTISLLMVSKLPLLSLKMTSLKIRGNEGRYILTGLVIITFIIFRFAAALLIIPLYLLVSLVSNSLKQH